MAINVVNGRSSINEAGLTYLHPSITSMINSEEVTFEGITGNVKLFCALPTEKGEDNKTKLITSPEEFLFKYGNPNIKKYGQAAYNVQNWLESGGEAYVLRVLPDNAGYAHAFLNIQTKHGIKKIKDVNGKLVGVPNVSLRPVVTYTRINNVSDTLLEYELNKERKELSVDGFRNNMIMTIYPNGRGSSYNNLGFRLTLNTSYDDAYDFRVYNFEVIKFDEYNTANIIEGPFYVSLEPSALSNSNESMFIADVINKYSNHLKCRFNDSSYDRVCKTINPDVNPKNIDILTGRTRMMGGEIQKYFCKETSNFEDIHMSLHKYDENGSPILLGNEHILNIPEPEDVIQNSIIIIDNKVRDTQFNNGKTTIENMKKALDDVFNDKFVPVVESILVSSNNTTVDKDCEAKTKLDELAVIWTDVESSHTAFEANKTDDKFYIFNSYINSFEITMESLIKSLVKVSDYIRTTLEDQSKIQIIDSIINEIRNINDTKEVLVVNAISYKGTLNNLSKEINNHKVMKFDGDELDGIIYLTSKVKDAYDYTNRLARGVFPVVDPDMLLRLTTASNKYNEVYDSIELLSDGYLPDDSRDIIIMDIYNKLEEIVDILYVIILECVVEINFSKNELVKTKVSSNLLPSLLPISKAQCEYVTTTTASPDGKMELIKRSKINIDLTSNALVVLNSIIYTNSMQDFNSPIKLVNGSDGDLEISTPSPIRDTAIKNLLIKAYRGSIDNDITNKKLVPFQHVLDANYPIEVKQSIITLTKDIRKDIFAWIDTGFTASPQDAINWRQSQFNVNTQFAGIFTQDFLVFDEYGGKNIKVTMTYFLASKIPNIAKQYGLHYTLAGPRRGNISGFKAISFTPNEVYKEELYTRQINYVESDPKRTIIGSQLTADNKNTPLSNINNVLTILDMRRNLERLSEDYQFEFEDSETINTLQYELNNFLSKYVSNRSCEEVKATVYASDYDKSQKILRIRVSIKFNNVIERIVISLDVVK